MIFVIDSNNIERITEAHEELAKLMAEKRLKDALLLIYANKQVQIVQLVLNCYQGCVHYCDGSTLTAPYQTFLLL